MQVLVWVLNCILCQPPQTSRVSSLVIFDFSSFLDLDECKAGVHKCHPNAVCTNSFGSYSCQCKPGFPGNGTFCGGVATFFETIESILVQRRVCWCILQTRIWCTNQIPSPFSDDMIEELTADSWSHSGLYLSEKREKVWLRMIWTRANFQSGAPWRVNCWISKSPSLHLVI